MQSASDALIHICISFREARTRILKCRGVSYIRQYESGMLSKEAVRILMQAVEIALDTDDLFVDLGDLKKLFKKRVGRHLHSKYR